MNRNHTLALVRFALALATACDHADQADHEDEATTSELEPEPEPQPEATPDLGDEGAEESGEGDDHDTDGTSYDRVSAWLVDGNGDLLVEASVGEEVAALHPGADHYAMRFSDETLLVTLVDHDDEPLYGYRQDVGSSQSFAGASFDASIAFGPVPDIFDFLCPAFCVIDPCFCPFFPWPDEPGDGNPGILEVAQLGTGIAGKLRLDGFEIDVSFGPDGERHLDPVTLPLETAAALDVFSIFHADSALVIDEVAALALDGTIPVALECSLAEMAPDHVAVVLPAGFMCLVHPDCPPAPEDVATCDS